MRHRDWALRLHDTFKASLGRPFSWGEFDCCLFAADCCLAVCGIDPAAPYRGQYASEAGAKRALAAIHGSLEAAWDACFARVAPAFAQRGDVGLYEGPSGRAMAVHWAGDWWSTAEEGVRRIHCTPLIVWRVGA